LKIQLSAVASHWKTLSCLATEFVALVTKHFKVGNQKRRKLELF